MAEIVHLRDGAPVELRPCPSWCTGETHFHEDLVADPDDGFHHYGPEAATPTFDRICIDDPEIIVTAVVKAWTCPLDAEPGSARVQLALAPGGVITELSAELTPGQARDVARTLLELAAVAEVRLGSERPRATVLGSCTTLRNSASGKAPTTSSPAAWSSHSAPKPPTSPSPCAAS